MSSGAALAWDAAYVGAALALAAPAGLVAMRRGLGAGVLAAWATLVGFGLAAWLCGMIYSRAFPTDRFAAGFGLSIVIGWMGLFVAPAMAAVLACAFLARRHSGRAGRSKA